MGYSKASRRWVDNQTSLIGQNSVIINTGNNTNLKGAIIANKKADGTDGNNLLLNTKSLTYANIIDKDKARSLSIGGGYSTQGNNQSAQNTTNANINYSMHDKEQITRATIGGGDIVIAGMNVNINESLVKGLNRDISISQEITKSLEVSPIEVSATIRTTTENNETKITNPITAKLTEWKEIANNPLKPIEDNFKGIGYDIDAMAVYPKNGTRNNNSCLNPYPIYS